jgi:hypothetical protein
MIGTDPIAVDLRRVTDWLSAFRFDCADEYRLQAGVAMVLSANGCRFEREAVLSDADRVDFLTASGLAIECKVDGSPADVTRQLLRYLIHDRVAGLLLVTARSQLAATVRGLGPKPARAIALARSAL